MKTPEITPTVVKYIKINPDCPAIKHPIRLCPETIKPTPPMENGVVAMFGKPFLALFAAIGLTVLVGSGVSCGRIIKKTCANTPDVTSCIKKFVNAGR